MRIPQVLFVDFRLKADDDHRLHAPKEAILRRPQIDYVADRKVEPLSLNTKTLYPMYTLYCIILYNAPRAHYSSFNVLFLHPYITPMCHPWPTIEP